MKKILWLVACLSLPCMAQEVTGNLSSESITAKGYRPGRIEHIVLFKYRRDVSDQTRRQVADRFLGLKNQCVRNGAPYIASIVTGAPNSLEGLDGGFDQGFIVSFNSEGDRNYYVGTPVIKDPHLFDAKHDEFKHFVKPLLLTGPEGVLVFDFRVQDN
jgi:hypothetical protein